jgi:hypothetical protein
MKALIMSMPRQLAACKRSVNSYSTVFTINITIHFTWWAKVLVEVDLVLMVIF